MTHHVTIEGSVTPTDWLPRGVRRTVEVTADIRKLVAIGGAIVVAGSLDEPDTAAYGDRGEILDQLAADAAEDDAYAQVSEFPAAAEVGAEPPKRGRSRKASEPDEPQP
ncbi:hypothetical protein A5784_14155 [Mycobacterium sp. 852013-50091_SCH5140682]|uniref:hypothetical protein n=1 Tax=Mycobacterium sp. 852013-50091_SCH5140682 TaxID=1834109 RepID=UPI0007EAC250|nr:hypothetical protein [Mycobacterium sp. 852013-50091_SCH5140682]OBC03371.1 hypothetical protein A5784_14155 [Mycobacterium sp. 852013-50091_SCH5140682]